ncbi:glycoside hydrolase family 6 protein [Streptomyces sp. NPDC051018]|uniref:glycoside hydrolase family 6 protein n=1 Tax=Streptomyces sp. NPDC051018 TaxID=3365639 RepID=UPI003796E8D2
MYGSRSRRTGARAGVLGALLALSACAPGEGGGTTAGPGRPPVETVPYWSDPGARAWQQVRDHIAEGDDAKARLIRRIASRPVARWAGSDDSAADVRAYTDQAARAGRDGLLVLYYIPHRDCGQYSAGGAPDAAAYRAWVDGVARAIGGRRVTVILEPDAVPHLVDGCLPRELRQERYELLRGAVERLKRQPGTTVYLDAGHPGWITPDRLREPLLRAGIGRADGFSANVSNFHPTGAVVDFGHRLSALVGGKHFVVDTGRNGNGAPTAGDPRESWCNPPGRALGEPPTVKTGDPLVDAYLWIKPPGESDGECRGGPGAGEWWPEYALGLAREAG